MGRKKLSRFNSPWRSIPNAVKKNALVRVFAPTHSLKWLREKVAVPSPKRTEKVWQV